MDKWFIAMRKFKAGIVEVKPGEAIDASGWRNTRALEEASFIRSPKTEEEKERIEEARMEGGS